MTASAAPVRDPAWSLSRSAIGLWVTEGVIGTLVWAALVVAFLAFVPDGGPVPVLRWLLTALVAVDAVVTIGIRPWIRYRVHRWEVTGTAVYTQRGWWARERRIAPMSRVQTVDLAQGPVARLFGLAPITVTTASAAGPLQTDGLDHQTAVRLLDDLTATADAVGGDAT